jgi:choline dehydrogenase-like flavoprotein
MFVEAKDVASGTRLQADVCIIGGGAAGITIARALDSPHCKTILIAGGGKHESALGTDLYSGSVSPPHTHEPLQENRVRAWGGSTIAWGGRCIPYEEIDFRRREWMPHSGWPITFAELSPYIDAACNVCEAGKPVFDARQAFPDRQPEILAGFDGDEMTSWQLERWSPPTNFATRYGTELKRSSNVTVMLDGHVVRLAADASARVVNHAVVAVSPHHRFNVEAKTFVLAAGGLENPRLLLASNDVIATGLGNARDVVGRFYQSHRFGVCGHAVLRNPLQGIVYEFERDPQGVYCRRRFRLSDAAQMYYRVGNAIGFFARPGTGAAVHRNAVTSSVHLAKAVIRAAKRGPVHMARELARERTVLAEHVKTVVNDGLASAPDLWRLAVARFGGRRRLPSVLPPQRLNCFHLYYQTEHAPNPISRVMLSGERDTLGMPRLAVSVAFSPIDFDTVRHFYRVFAARFANAGSGLFTYSEEALEDQLNVAGSGFNSNAHHIGTTRMASLSTEGVVDEQCRVHGMTNLFVAGSSVFPTSGHANPTLMIVALALRLGAHIKSLHRTTN